jgi:hypothetical protein
MTTAGDDGSLEGPFFGERALLMCAGVVNREEPSVCVRHRDAVARDFDEGHLTWLDVACLGER